MQPPSQNIASQKSRESGMSMIEVLIAIVILAIGALGIAGLQARALKGNENSLQRSQAIIASSYMLDLIRADRTLASAFSSRTTIESASTAPNALSAAWIREMQEVRKDSNGKDILPTIGNGTIGIIECTPSGTQFLCEVTVQWNSSRASTDARSEVSLRTLL